MNTCLNFENELQLSKGVSKKKDFREILLQGIPGAIDVVEANGRDDRAGVDYWVERSNGRPLSVDLKSRRVDYKAKNNASDDLTLETWSVVGKKKGWSIDEQKITDIVLFYWLDTGRFCLMSFPHLCKVCQLHLFAWRRLYKVNSSKTVSKFGEWKSEAVYVPRRIVWKAIYDAFGGNGKKAIEPSPAIVAPDDQIDLFGGVT